MAQTDGEYGAGGVVYFVLVLDLVEVFLDECYLNFLLPVTNYIEQNSSLNIMIYGCQVIQTNYLIKFNNYKGPKAYGLYNL